MEIYIDSNKEKEEKKEHPVSINGGSYDGVEDTKAKADVTITNLDDDKPHISEAEQIKQYQEPLGNKKRLFNGLDSSTDETDSSGKTPKIPTTNGRAKAITWKPKPVTVVMPEQQDIAEHAKELLKGTPLEDGNKYIVNPTAQVVINQNNKSGELRNAYNMHKSNNEMQVKRLTSNSINPTSSITDDELRLNSIADKRIAGIGDALMAFSNLYFVTKGAPNSYTGTKTLSQGVRDHNARVLKMREQLLDFIIKKQREERRINDSNLNAFIKVMKAENDNYRLAEKLNNDYIRTNDNTRKTDSIIRKDNSFIKLNDKKADKTVAETDFVKKKTALYPITKANRPHKPTSYNHGRKANESKTAPYSGSGPFYEAANGSRVPKREDSAFQWLKMADGGWERFISNNERFVDDKDNELPKERAPHVWLQHADGRWERFRNPFYKG